MRWWLYNCLFAAGYLLMLPYFFVRMRRRGGYRARFADRFGVYPDEVRETLATLRGAAIWIHAVSVGEVYVAGQMMHALRMADASVRFVLSTTSSTGWQEAQKQVSPGDVAIYHPVDLPGIVRRALAAVRPRALVLTESEIWPNLILSCQARGIPVFLINARISDRSAPRYRMLRFWFGPAFRAFRTIFAQSDLDKTRLVAAGADPAAVHVTGSFKFDAASRNPEKERKIRAFLRESGLTPPSRILLGGSIWPGEDVFLLEAYARLRLKHPDLRLVLVPRHFEKADEVQASIERAGLVCVRESRFGSSDPTAFRDAAARGDAVWIGDTTGELMGFYGCADLVFVGKSLCEHGAQNMIEPCLCGVATLLGPFTENFRPVMSDLLAAGALIQAPDREALIREMDRLLTDDAARRTLGERAREAVLHRKGCVGACAEELLNELREERTPK